VTVIDSWSSATSGGRGPVDADVKRLLHEHLTGLDPFLAEVARTFDHLVNPSTRHPDTVVLRIDATWFTELLEVHDVAARDRAALALAMLAMHTQAQDQRIDRDLADPSLAWATDVLSSTLLVEAIAMLCGIAGGDPLFWAQTRAAFTESARGCLAERTLGTGSDELVGERLVSVVAGRMATLRILVTALACHSRRHERTQPVQRAIDHLLVAQKLRDDISDWRDDHARGMPTVVLLRLAQRVGRPLHECSPDDVADALYLFGGLEALVDEIDDHLRRAAELIEPYPHRRMGGYVKELRRECAALAERVRAHKAGNAAT